MGTIERQDVESGVIGWLRRFFGGRFEVEQCSAVVDCAGGPLGPLTFD